MLAEPASTSESSKVEMKIKYFSDRDHNAIVKHLEEAGDVEVISLFAHNNRTVVYYVDKPTRGRKPKERDIDHG